MILDNKECLEISRGGIFETFFWVNYYQIRDLFLNYYQRNSTSREYFQIDPYRYYANLRKTS